MDNYNWLIAEILLQQRERQLASARPHASPEPPAHGGLRRTLAAAMVRLGLRLDPAAGEGLGAFALAPEGRR